MAGGNGQSSIAGRDGKPFAFKRNGEEFLPAAGARIRYASNDTDTLTLPGLPVGLLGTGDVVSVEYRGVQVFKGTVSTRTERQGRGTDRVEDVTVEGPWGLMSRLVFRQEWKVAGENGVVGATSSRLVLNQSALGEPQDMTAQVREIADYAAAKCGFSCAAGDVDAGAQQLPADEARDLTCAAAIVRTLRFFPQTVCRFDYSAATPAFHVAAPPENPAPAAYLATVPMTQRTCTRTAHPVVGVDIATESYDLVAGDGETGSAMRSLSHQTAGVTDSVDTLHVYLPLEHGGGSSSSESMAVEVLDENHSVWKSVTFWIRNHPALAGLVYAPGTTNGISKFGPITPDALPYPRLTDTTVGDLRRFGLHAEVVRLTCPVTVVTPDKEEDLVLTLDYVCTDATSRTYTRQTGSSSEAGETLPEGLAAAILAQRGGELMSEEITIRLGDSFPTLGDADVADGQTLYLQAFEVDCYDLTAQLHFGRPPYLSPEDMRDLLLGFRQRAFASNAPNRGEPDADDNTDDVGGVQPLKSSSAVVSSVAKATVKGNGGTIVLDSSKVTDGTMKVRTLTLQGEDGGTQTVQYLATSDAVISHGEREDDGDEDDDDEDDDEDTGYCNDISRDDGKGGDPHDLTGAGVGDDNDISEDPDGDNDISNDPCKRGAQAA